MKATVTAIVDKALFDVPGVVQVLENALDNGARQVATDYNRITAPWKHRVSAEIRRRAGVRDIEMNSDIFGYVDDGTRAHDIRPRNGTHLAFQGSYKAKTQPGILGSNSGGGSGVTVFAKAVRHPGTKARNFTQTIADKHENTFQKLVDKALQDFDL